ncbi:MAG: hypothetical protein JJE12_03100 [Anaerolineales bacterium]|nr:hypothetical protein [Anaerolineales bacterium]
MTHPPPESKPKISRYAVSGAIILPLGLLVFLLVFPTNLPTTLTALLIALGGIAIIASTTMGFLAIRQIRSTGGRYSGIRLAVFLSLFYPIILLDLLLSALGWSILGRLTTSSLAPLVWLVVVILVDYWIVRISWNRAII